jgi:hypothetical protein
MPELFVTATGRYTLTHTATDRWHVATPERLRPVEFANRTDAETWIGRPLREDHRVVTAT